MSRFTFLAVAFAATLSAPVSATPIVKEYGLPGWTEYDGVKNTVFAVGGLEYGGKITDVSQVEGASIIIGLTWSGMFTNWVAKGGIFIQHDWNLSARSLPGMIGLQAASYVYDDINVIDSASAVVKGPFGTITDSLLDGGSSSIHGAWRAASLVSSDPLAGKVHAILSSTDANAVAAFEYSYGLGHILYSSMPLEAYTDSLPLKTATQPAGMRIYANNELAYASSLLRSDNEVPEPASLALLGAGVTALAFGRRRARKA